MTTKEQSGSNDAPGTPSSQTATAQPPALWKTNPVQMIDRMFGKHHWAREWVLGLCESDPQFLLHIIQQPPYYVHFLCLVRLALLEKSEKGSGRWECAGLMRCGRKEEILQESAELIRIRSKKETMQEFYVSYPKAFMKTLSKLGNDPLEKGAYCCLMQLLLEKKSHRCIKHTEHIHRFSLYAYTILPEEFRFFEIARCIPNHHSYIRIMQLLFECKKRNITITKNEINKNKKKITHDFMLSEFLENKLNSFPKPPWKGNDRIQPICSMKELKKFDSFFEFYDRFSDIDKIRYGKFYAYVCKETQAVIPLHKLYGSWYIGLVHYNGVRQHQITQEIFSIFIDAGFLDVEYGLRKEPTNTEYVIQHNVDKIRKRIFR